MLNKEEILNMARTAGLNPRSFFMESKLKRFAELVAEAERESCAKLVEGYGTWEHNHVLTEAIRTKDKQ